MIICVYDIMFSSSKVLRKIYCLNDTMIVQIELFWEITSHKKKLDYKY